EKRRPKRCPVKDTILVHIPFGVSADMGVAMRRTRAKRIKRIHKWLASGGGGKDDDDGAAAVAGGSGGTRNDDVHDHDHDNRDGGANGESGRRRGHDDEDDAIGLAPLKPRHYGSVVDYLEAKYVRGVMLDDYDEKVRKGKRVKPMKGEGKEGDGGEESSFDSEPSGISVYSDDDGFIDDTLLNEEVAGQVLASSSYGMTQIEEEALKRKRNRRREKERRGVADEGGDDVFTGDDLAKNGENDDDEMGYGSDFDDGFFVNIGDLEMASGWRGELHDTLFAPSPTFVNTGGGEAVKEKRKYVRKVPYAGKSEEKIAKKKTGIIVKPVPPGLGKKKKKGTLAKKSEKNESGDGGSGCITSISTTKKKKKKKKKIMTNEKGKVIAKKANKEEGKEKEEDADSDGQMNERKTSDVGMEKTNKKQVNREEMTKVNKKVAGADGKTTTKKKAVDAGGKAGDTDSNMRDKKSLTISVLDSSISTKKNEANIESSTIMVAKNANSPNKKKRSASYTSSPDTITKEKNTISLSDKDSDSKSPPSSRILSENPPPDIISKEKDMARHLRAQCKRRYNACLKQIKEMTTDELPRKLRNKNTMKVSVNIPSDKEIGDEITFGCVEVYLAVFVFAFSCFASRLITSSRINFAFANFVARTHTQPWTTTRLSNPNVPGQKLKVKIPNNADMDKRSFVVSVPTPKVKEPVDFRENNFPREFREALHSYSCAYDDWCDAEGKYNEILPAYMRKQFKPVTEKLKKFDDMLEEFPKNLATPIDVSYLRKIVRMERSNKQKRENNRQRKEKRRSGEGGDADPKIAITQQQPQDGIIHIPRRGTKFPTIVFDKRDFPED
ncbi:hypothetical protein ACHAXA_004848, partial [Cyclostephanos tholiformis]